MKRHYIECVCESPEHTIKFSYEPEEHDKMWDHIYLSIFLSEHTWFKKFIRGIKYIFGYKCRYGHFEEIVINKEKAKELKEILEQFIERK